MALERMDLISTPPIRTCAARYRIQQRLATGSLAYPLSARTCSHLGDRERHTRTIIAPAARAKEFYALWAADPAQKCGTLPKCFSSGAEEILGHRTQRGRHFARGVTPKTSHWLCCRITVDLRHNPQLHH